MSHDHSFQKVCFIFYTSLPVFYEDHHKECPLTKVEEVLVLEIQFWRSLQSTFITASSYRWNQLASNNFLNQRDIEDNNQFGNYLQTLFFDKTKSSEKITLVEGDKSFVQNAKNAEILDHIKRPTDSTTSTTSGQTNTTSGQTSTTNGQTSTTNGQTSTTSG